MTGLFQTPDINQHSTATPRQQTKVVRLNAADDSEIVHITRAKLSQIAKGYLGKGRRRGRDELATELGFRTPRDLATFVAAARGQKP
ncbi:hypothetical protein [Nocardioides sp.]|uniref:hypothetical protein n=1 Tax=Nocardioides sp. TaxID=35761 RepID=UPI003784264F